MEVKDRIRTRRMELGLTLEQVGDYVGVSKSTVRKWETGFISNMRRDKIVKLADILKLSPIDLMDDPDAAFAAVTETMKKGMADIQMSVSDTDPQLAELNNICSGLTADGIQRVIEYATDISENPKYQKKKPSDEG